MNVLDSEMVIADLKRHGYTVVGTPKEADCVFYNTCSVREHAEEKVYSALGKIRQTKEQYPDKLIGVMGCMAQKDQQVIFKRAPYVDFIVGPGQLQQVPDLIDQARLGEEQQMAVGLGRREGSNDDIKRSHETFDPLRDPTMRPTPYQAYLRIQIGCDKFCTYCVVPNTRGPEQGRPPQQIVEEAKVLADQGCLEITLLGQTVNSYSYTDGQGKTTRMSDLLKMLHEVNGIERIKFVTNYPRDMKQELLETIRDLPKISPYLHVPLQHGSNDMLKRMRRGYTVEEYREMMHLIWDTLPNAAISSDFIVGFCGETDEEFQTCIDSVREFRFKNSFIFKYSEREGTKAESMLIDDVPYQVKQERNNALLAVQNEVSEAENIKFIGHAVDVLVEGPSKKADKLEQNGPLKQMVGRTHCDRIVVFDGNERQAGQILPVSIYETTPFTLFGAVVTQEAGPEVYAL